MIERGGRHWEGSAMALPAWEDCACDKKIIGRAQLIFGSFLLFSTRSDHVGQRADGSIRGCVLRLQSAAVGILTFITDIATAEPIIW